VNREDLTELHYMVHFENIPSILAHGILSHNRATKLAVQSIAMEEIQNRRAQIRIPGAGRGRPLHDYVNLYFHARNPMLYKRRGLQAIIGIFSVDSDVLDLPGALIADRNASSDYVRFAPSPGGLSLVEHELVFARSWTHPDDPIAEMRHRSIKCAEVLVPDHISLSLIRKIYVVNQGSCNRLLSICNNTPSIPISVNTELFF